VDWSRFRVVFHCHRAKPYPSIVEINLILNLHTFHMFHTYLYVSAYFNSPDIGSDPGDRTKIKGVRADESWKHL
jgi:hypothetical protein